MKIERTDIILRKIREMKQGEFGATAIKIELEADFDRGDDSCSTCDGVGTTSCSECDGEGYIVNSEYDGYVAREHARDGTSYDVDEYIRCEDCLGTTELACDDCPDSFTDAQCYDYIMSRMEAFGLAERKEPRRIEFEHYGSITRYNTNWHPKGALAFAAFYDDGSVDSEFTFTLKLDDPEIVLVIPKIIEIFKSLGDEIGNGMDMSRAGMHTAILHTPDGVYPYNAVENDHKDRFLNFKKSMNMLLPALFFLASNDEKSRDLQFRAPRVASKSFTSYSNNKYSAIYYNGGALEYRVFNTCYDAPDTILDNIVVIANSIRYWSTKYRPSVTKFEKCKFGVNRGETLERFYKTYEHIELLNAGLRKLKPLYFTIGEIKAQRKFKRTQREIRSQMSDVETKAKEAYIKYETRHKWDFEVIKKRVEAELLENYVISHTMQDISEESVWDEIRPRVSQYIEDRYNDGSKKSLSEYTHDFIQTFNRENAGEYTLEGDMPEPTTRGNSSTTTLATDTYGLGAATTIFLGTS